MNCVNDIQRTDAKQKNNSKQKTYPAYCAQRDEKVDESRVPPMPESIPACSVGAIYTSS